MLLIAVGKPLLTLCLKVDPLNLNISIKTTPIHNATNYFMSLTLAVF